MFPETIMVFTKKQIHFLCSQKVSLLEVVKKSAKDVERKRERETYQNLKVADPNFQTSRGKIQTGRLGRLGWHTGCE